MALLSRSQLIRRNTARFNRSVVYPTMLRFFFKVDASSGDLEVDLPDLATAKCEAVRYAGQLLCDRASEFWDRGDFSMTVTDGERLTLFTLQFSALEAPAIAYTSSSAASAKRGS